MSTIPDHLRTPLIELLLAVADDKLLLGHRNSDWTGLAPILEEDIAFSSLAQDEMAHAAAIYEFAGNLVGRTADQLAFGRTAGEYRCSAIVEVPDEFDWATAICRQFFCDHYDLLRLTRLAATSHAGLKALSARLRAEEAVHVEHVDGWMRRLGRGTEESAARVQEALDRIAPIAASLAEPVEGEAALEAAGLYPHLPGGADHFDAWTAALAEVASAAGLRLELDRPGPDFRGGRRGAHSEHLAPLLEEMGAVFRLEPEAAW